MVCPETVLVLHLGPRQDIEGTSSDEFPAGRPQPNPRRELSFEYTMQEYREDHPSGKKRAALEQSRNG